MAQNIVLASAVRAATNQSADQIRGALERGVHVIINMTAVPGVDTVTFAIQGKDALGNYYTLLTATAIVTTGVTVLKIYPGETTAANVAISDALPDVWRVTATHSAASNFTYSVTANTLQ